MAVSGDFISQKFNLRLNTFSPRSGLPALIQELQATLPPPEETIRDFETPEGLQAVEQIREIISRRHPRKISN